MHYSQIFYFLKTYKILSKTKLKIIRLSVWVPIEKTDFGNLLCLSGHDLLIAQKVIDFGKSRFWTFNVNFLIFLETTLSNMR